jgi:signal transduction histidine kinase
LLHHIVGNLFSNACKYSPPGSRIHITLRHSPPGFIFAVALEALVA